jgi:hypothetical protein
MTVSFAEFIAVLPGGVARPAPAGCSKQVACDFPAVRANHMNLPDRMPAVDVAIAFLQAQSATGFIL